MKTVHVQRCAQSNTLFLQGQKADVSDGNTTGLSLTSAHTCRTKELFSSLCGDKLASIALQLPQTAHQEDLSLHVKPPNENFSLVELLVSLIDVNHGDES